MNTQQRALELTDWLGNNDIHQMDPNMLLSVVKSFLMMEHVTALKEAAQVVETGQERFSTGRGEDTRSLSPRSHGNIAGLAYAEAIRALAEERSIG